MIEQLIPSDYCLKCKGCCRFKEELSVWAPCLLQEEIQGLLDKKIPSASIGADRRLHPVAAKEGEGFFCPFLERGENKCRIYEFRPFECQLYPFLLSLRNNKVLLTVDPNCPYARQHLDSKEFKKYAEHLLKYLNSPAQLRLLKENPRILAAYEEVLDLAELDIPDETA